jgi:hypothetical protein
MQDIPARRVFIMSSTTLYRLSGISLLIGSLLLIIGDIPDSFTGNGQASAISTTSALIRLIGAMLIALGLPSMYARFAGRAGVLGLIGFTCTFFFFLMAVVSETIVIFTLPLLLAHGLLNGGAPPLGLLITSLADAVLALVGGVLLGIAIMRTHMLPRWAGVALIVGSIPFALGSALDLPITDVGLIIFAAGLAWLAVGMLSQQPTTVEALLPPSEVRA